MTLEAGRLAAIPPVLYKYRRFSPRTVEQLCRDQVHYADPSTFNDPLDTKPCVEADCDVQALRQALFELVRRRVEAHMKAGARAVKYRGPKTAAHIDKHSKNAAQQTIDTLEYDATNPEYEEAPPGPLNWLLGQEMERELLRQYDRGVLSLAKRFNCPLMWSHYGDQHRGICLGYRIPHAARSKLHPVDYGGERTVLASSVAAMLKGDEKARDAVDSAVLLKKARDWRYEKELRLLGPRGDADSPLELIEVLVRNALRGSGQARDCQGTRWPRQGGQAIRGLRNARNVSAGASAARCPRALGFLSAPGSVNRGGVRRCRRRREVTLRTEKVENAQSANSCAWRKAKGRSTSLCAGATSCWWSIQGKPCARQR